MITKDKLIMKIATPTNNVLLINCLICHNATSTAIEGGYSMHFISSLNDKIFISFGTIVNPKFLSSGATYRTGGSTSGMADHLHTCHNFKLMRKDRKQLREGQTHEIMDKTCETVKLLMSLGF